MPDDSAKALQAPLKALYAAALDTTRWAGFLDATREALQAPVSGFSVFDAEQRTNRIWLTAGLDEQSLRDYDEHFAASNPRTSVLRDLPRGGWFRCHEHFDERFVRRNEFYQDFLAKRELRYAIAGVMVRSERFSVHFGAWRDGLAGAYDERDLAIVRELTPHLQSVLSHAAVAQGSDVSVVVEGEEGAAVILVGEGRRVLSMNAAAEQWLRVARRREVRVSHGTLDFATPGLNAAIDRQLDASRRLFRPRRAESLAAEVGFTALAEPLPGEFGRRMRLIPMSPDRVVWMPGSDVALARIVLDPAPDTAAARARPMLKLTSAEAEVARMVCRGLTLAEIASQREVKRSTVKSQIDALFQKSGTRTQKALAVKLVQSGFGDW
jgi:DNA-binding CsgD family transcriptional regulator